MSRAFPRVLTAELCRGPPKDSPSVAHVGYDISPLSRVVIRMVVGFTNTCVINTTNVLSSNPAHGEVYSIQQ
jgi:hypothetical protein